jgi:hypothetical protein
VAISFIGGGNQHRTSEKKKGKNANYLITLHLHLQDTSKLQCVEDFLEGMLGKLTFE